MISFAVEHIAKIFFQPWRGVQTSRGPGKLLRFTRVDGGLVSLTAG